MKDNKTILFRITIIVLMVANLAVGIASLAKLTIKTDANVTTKEATSAIAEKIEQRDISYLKNLIEGYPMNNKGKYPTSLSDVAQDGSLPELRELSCDFQGRGRYRCSYRSANGEVKTFSSL